MSEKKKLKESENKNKQQRLQKLQNTISDDNDDDDIDSDSDSDSDMMNIDAGADAAVVADTDTDAGVSRGAETAAKRILISDADSAIIVNTGANRELIIVSLSMNEKNEETAVKTLITDDVNTSLFFFFSSHSKHISDFSVRKKETEEIRKQE